MAGVTKYDDAVWRKLRRKVLEIAARDAHVKVGVLGSKAGGAQRGPKDELGNSTGIGMVELAAIHEFGSPAAGIPERSFIRATFAKNHDDLARLTAQLAGQVFRDEMSIARALGLLGTWGAAQVKAFIAEERVTPRLSDSPAGRRTIHRKGSSVTLVDTGRLINAIQFEVIE